MKRFPGLVRTLTATSKSAIAAAVLAAGFALTPHAHADVIFWDGGGAGVNWTTLNNWGTTGANTTTDPSAVPGLNDDVVSYSTGATKTTTDALGANITIQSLTFGNSQTSAVAIASGGSLTLNGKANFDPLAVASATASSNLGTVGIFIQSTVGAVTLAPSIVLGGSQSWVVNNGTASLATSGGGTTLTTGAINANGKTLTIAGTGQVLLGGVFSNGNITVASGGLRTNASANISSSTVLAVNSGAFFNLNGADLTVAGFNDGASGGGIISMDSGATSARTITLSGSGAYSFSGIIQNASPSHTVGLVISLTGTASQSLGGLSTFGTTTGVSNVNSTLFNSGTLNLNAGTADNTASSALGLGQFNITGSDPHILDNTSGTPVTLGTNNVQQWKADFTFTGTNDLNMGTGDVTMSAPRVLTINGATFTEGGAIGGGAFSITKLGAGTLALNSSASTYTGHTIVSLGTLTVGANAPVGAPGALGKTGTPVTLGSTSLTGQASFLISAADVTVGRNIAEIAAPTNSAFTIGGSNTTGTATFGGTVALTKDTNLSSATGGLVEFTNAISGAFNITVLGGGIVKLSSASNVFGGTAKTITVQNNTTLETSASANLGDAANALIFDNGTLKFDSPFDLSARTVTLNSGGATFDTNANNVSLANAIGNGGTGPLTKTGAGVLLLNAANTYSGTTTIHAGTLALGAAGTFANSPAIVVGDAGSSGALLDLTAMPTSFTFANSQTVSGIGTITIGAGKLITINGAINPGNSPGTLTVTGNLALAGTVNDQLTNGTNTLGTYDTIAVSGALTYGGILNVTAIGAGTLVAGTYTLFTGFTSTSGSFAGGIILPAAPGGFQWHDFAGSTFNYATGQIQLDAAAASTVAVLPNAADLAPGTGVVAINITGGGNATLTTPATSGLGWSTTGTTAGTFNANQNLNTLADTAGRLNGIMRGRTWFSVSGATAGNGTYAYTLSNAVSGEAVAPGSGTSFGVTQSSTLLSGDTLSGYNSLEAGGLNSRLVFTGSTTLAADNDFSVAWRNRSALEAYPGTTPPLPAHISQLISDVAQVAAPGFSPGNYLVIEISYDPASLGGAAEALALAAGKLYLARMTENGNADNGDAGDTWANASAFAYDGTTHGVIGAPTATLGDWGIETTGLDTSASRHYAWAVIDPATIDSTHNQFAVVPEPASLGLLALGAVGLLRRRK